MNTQSKLDQLLERFHQSREELEQEVERVLEEKRQRFQYQLQRGKVIFDDKLSQLQRHERISSLRYVLNAPMSFWLTAPIIYGMLLPLVLLDVSVTVYQHICFRVYKIPLVARGEYVVIDRHHLAYLNWIQKLNCIYCGYGNGILAYAREIIARTEQFWCPIKHASRPKGNHEREAAFLDYGDAEKWKSEWEKLRCDWSESEEKNNN